MTAKDNRTIIQQPNMLPVKPASDPEKFAAHPSSLVDSDPTLMRHKAAAWDAYVTDIGLSMALLDKFSDHRQSDTGIAVLAAATRLKNLCVRYDLECPF